MATMTEDLIRNVVEQILAQMGSQVGSNGSAPAPSGKDGVYPTADAAVQAATAAFATFKTRPLADRAAAVAAIKTICVDQAEELGRALREVIAAAEQERGGPRLYPDPAELDDDEVLERTCEVFDRTLFQTSLAASMTALADGLAARAIATLRYQFAYMERGSRRPDPPALAHATVRAAAAKAARLAGKLPLFAGGKSFGGRMTSQAQAANPLPEVRGLAFLGFPLHPPKQPSDSRAAHLLKVKIPLLFLQGARDVFAEPELLNPLITLLGDRATLLLLPDADHSFHVPARSRFNDAQINDDMINALAGWIGAVARK